ncbi:hypothetical protein [Nocardia sp. NPDC050710]|uniref:hypothetical protein n=1 Tax=Nocardia sp. NPDC050710 TaxID=3157220 RepID=UPI0033E8A59D
MDPTPLSIPPNRLAGAVHITWVITTARSAWDADPTTPRPDRAVRYDSEAADGSGSSARRSLGWL